MSRYHIIRTSRLTDRQILDFLVAIQKAFGFSRCHISLTPSTTSINDLPIDISSKALSSLYSPRHVISHVTATTNNKIHIQFLRGTGSDDSNPSSHRIASMYFDEIAVNSQSNNDAESISYSDSIEFVELMENSLPTTFPVHEGEGPHSSMDVFQLEMSRLGDVYDRLSKGISDEREKLIEENMNTRATLISEHENKKRKLEQQYEERRKTLEDDYSRIKEDMDKRETKLHKREGALNNREHMRVRRDLRTQISEAYKIRKKLPAVSYRSGVLRWSIFFLTMFAGVALSSYAIIGFENTFFRTDDVFVFEAWELVFIASRSSLLLAAGVGFAVYAINWIRRIYADDVRAEREYEKFGHDIDRASYVIETILEVSDKERVVIPDVWVEGVCKNLFSTEGRESHDRDDLNAMALLINAISGAKIGPDGTEVTIDRKGARRLGKKVAQK